MSLTSDFISGFFAYFNNLDKIQSMTLVIIIAILLIISPQIKKFIEWIGSKIIKKRSCGDCVLIIFGMSEKYISQEQMIKSRVLADQMNYVEQKIENIILELLQTYKEDQNTIIIDDKVKILDGLLEREYWGYKQSLTNAIELCKKEIRRSMKENGFHIMSGKDFSYYVKEKTQDLLSISRKYIMNDYPKDAIVPLNYRFSHFDEAWFEDIIFEIYIKAKDVKQESELKIKELEENLKNDINNFVDNRRSNKNDKRK